MVFYVKSTELWGGGDAEGDFRTSNNHRYYSKQATATQIYKICRVMMLCNNESAIYLGLFCVTEQYYKPPSIRKMPDPLFMRNGAL